MISYARKVVNSYVLFIKCTLPILSPNTRWPLPLVAAAICASCVRDVDRDEDKEIIVEREREREIILLHPITCGSVNERDSLID